MAIETKTLNPEQTKRATKLMKRYVLDWFLAIFLYFGFACFANLVIVYADTVYLHDAPTRTFLALGTAIVTYLGLLGTMREKKDILVKKIKAIADEQ